MAVEVEIPTPGQGKIHDVIYQPVSPLVDLESNSLPSDQALSILTHKHNEWDYEEEVRIIQEKEEWYELRTPARVTRIIVGHRFNEALFQALRIVCERKAITFKRTKVEDAGVVAVDVL